MFSGFGFRGFGPFETTPPGYGFRKDLHMSLNTFEKCKKRLLEDVRHDS